MLNVFFDDDGENPQLPENPRADSEQEHLGHCLDKLRGCSSGCEAFFNFNYEVME